MVNDVFILVKVEGVLVLDVDGVLVLGVEVVLGTQETMPGVLSFESNTNLQHPIYVLLFQLLRRLRFDVEHSPPCLSWEAEFSKLKFYV